MRSGSEGCVGSVGALTPLVGTTSGDNELEAPKAHERAQGLAIRSLIKVIETCKIPYLVHQLSVFGTTDE